MNYADTLPRKRDIAARYECELPPEVLAELMSPPRRPRILKQPPLDPTTWSRLVLSLLAVLMTVGGLVAVLIRSN